MPIKSTNNRLADRAIRHAIYLERQKSSQVNDIISFLRDRVVADLMEGIKSRMDAGRDNWTTRRMLENYQEMAATISEGMSQVSERSMNSLTNLAQAEARWHTALLGEIVPLSIEFAMPSFSLLRQLASTTPVEGRLVTDWFSSIGTQTAKDISDQIRLGLALGESVDKIVARITGGPSATTLFGGGSIGQMNRRAAAVVRTAMTSISSVAREETYKENTDVIKAVQIVATLDMRTTEICRSEDGNVYPVGEGPRPPFHWNCRTVTVPVTKSWKELGSDLKTKEVAGTRASMDGQVSDKLTYPEWLEKQSKEVQEEVLGKKQAEEFRAGRLKIDSFKEIPPKTLEMPGRQQVPWKDPNSELKKQIEARIHGFGLNASIDDLATALVPRTDDVFTSVYVKKGTTSLTFGSIRPDRIEIKRTIEKFGSTVVVTNDQLHLGEFASKGVGTKLFAQQAKMLQKLGIEFMDTFAAGSARATFNGQALNGYYTWARLGYDAEINPILVKRLPEFLKSSKRISDLMKSSEGRLWWKENGLGFEGRFDLRPGSQSMRVLEAYLKEKSFAG